MEKLESVSDEDSIADKMQEFIREHEEMVENHLKSKIQKDSIKKLITESTAMIMRHLYDTMMEVHDFKKNENDMNAKIEYLYKENSRFSEEMNKLSSSIYGLQALKKEVKVAAKPPRRFKASFLSLSKKYDQKDSYTEDDRKKKK